MTELLDRRALNRALLARQLLLARSPMSPLDAVTHLVGMQAQAPHPPYVGLWTRLVGFDMEDLSALLSDRQVVRIAVMRGTIHLVTAADALLLRPLVQPVFDRALAAAFGRALAGVDPGLVAAAARPLLEAEPMTFAELGTRLRETWPAHDGGALAQAARARLPLVQPPPRALWGRSGRALHTTAESWLGRPLAVDPDPGGVVLRYLAAFGPATVADAQAWSGLTRLRDVVGRLPLITFRDENGRELYDLPDAPRPDPGTVAPVRFLPEFDNILLSHADRSRIVSEEHRARLFGVNGIIGASVLVDGFVRGAWRIERSRAAATLVVEPYAPLSKRHLAAVTAEGSRLLTAVAPDATGAVRWSES